MVHARPQFHAKKGTLTFAADDVRLVGLGELLARIEHLKGILGAEGLFEPSRKRALPFLPAHGRADRGAAGGRRARRGVQRARPLGGGASSRSAGSPCRVRARCPRSAPPSRSWTRDPRVDVIVVARGGGSFEDLLPFSNEALVRVAAACRTPLVSAIGHHLDTPLLDLVADFRASTPTDAAKRIVPDVERGARRGSPRRGCARGPR